MMHMKNYPLSFLDPGMFLSDATPGDCFHTDVFFQTILFNHSWIKSLQCHKLENTDTFLEQNYPCNGYRFFLYYLFCT